MSLRILIDNFVKINFEKNNRKYEIGKNEKTELYYVIFWKGALKDYPELFEYEVVDTAYWEGIERFIEGMVE